MTGTALAAPLDGLRVVDLTTELGVLCVRLLAGFGAEVTRIEPVTGDPLRQKPPVATGVDGSPESLYWLHMMRGRQLERVDLKTPLGRERLRSLLEDADVVVESRPPGELSRLGLDYESLGASLPQLVWTSITPFGRGGPRSAWKATDLIGMAAGGLLSLCGDADRAPLRPSAEQGYAQASLHALVGTLVALEARQATGLGQLVDVSMQEAVATCLGNARLFYELEGVVSRRVGGGRAYGQHGSRLVYPCADGYVSFSRTPDALAPLAAWMREHGCDPSFDPEEWARLPQSGPGTPGPEKARELEDAVTAFFAAFGKMALYEEGQARGIMICPVASPADLLENRQLVARGYFGTLPFPELGRDALAPGPPVRMGRSPWRDEPADGHPASTSRPTSPRVQREADSREILAGLRVADFSWVGVGPLATQVLAWLGAEVIRVESATRLDVFRSSGPRRGHGVDASAYWANCNRDKRAMTLNLRNVRGREVALRLAARSDILVESFTPGFMASVGLTYDDIRAVNPNIIMLSCSMEGATGPHARFRGFGLVLQSTVGFTYFTRWPDRPPTGTGVAYTDWVATHFAAAALLAALEHRRRTGEGQYVDLSQLEACIWALDAEVLLATTTGEVRPPLGNRHPEMCPHGVFPTAGEDRWIALACPDDASWRRLATIIGDASLMGAEFASLAGRRNSEEAIEAAVARWTAPQDGHVLASLLQEQDVPASVVADVGNVHADPQLRARGHFWRTAHPVIGEADWDGPAYRLSRTPLYPVRAAPLLGEDNAAVYGDVLGYSEAEIASLVADGVLE